ncbi:lanthionine synthetase LanC family protein [Corynebacterium kozikiae]|uniref:lanthionine synthetase LanC family protein n=1 Tax=Corynebacterium kozikiae TaxID=2968469 RepID=UPI00211C44DC|nr:lanthionine synthetase LanC family protein [Corynebacterium sp. 76QC2CO]MCQ9344099.1 hypothetical protein [Corynebacterium sp. 76QC2CO]
MTTIHSTEPTMMAIDYLYSGLTSPKRVKVVGKSPFSMIDGNLGDAYTASTMFHYTNDERWWEFLIDQVSSLTSLLRKNRFDQEGLLGGLSGLAFLLNRSKRNDSDFKRAIDSLLGRINTLTERRLWTVHNSIGVKRENYDFALGLSGTAHFLFSIGEKGLPLAKKICDEMADRSKDCFPDCYWTCANDLDSSMVENIPGLVSGLRDLGFAHGVSSVINTLKCGYQVFNENRYLHAAEEICEIFVENIKQNDGQGISYYEIPSPLQETPLSSPLARQAWCYGIPSLEISIAGLRTLKENIYSCLEYPNSYFDPIEGHFEDMGLCHGVAGRQYIADKLQLPVGGTWQVDMRKHVDSFLTRHQTETDLSFWHGIAGTLAVTVAIDSKMSYAPAMEVLGV